MYNAGYHYRSMYYLPIYNALILLQLDIFIKEGTHVTGAESKYI